MLKRTIFVSCLAFTHAAFSESLGRTIHIDRTFAEGTTKAGFYPKESLPECLWGLMYIDLSNEAGRAIFSLALAAKISDQAVVRVDYSKDSSGKCLVSGMHTK